jgi:hypothetical protein
MIAADYSPDGGERGCTDGSTPNGMEATIYRRTQRQAQKTHVAQRRNDRPAEKGVAGKGAAAIVPVSALKRPEREAL